MLDLLRDAQIRQILSLRGRDADWRGDLDRLLAGDRSLTRDSAGEGGIRAVQRLLVFLGYSTSSTGAYVIDGDFGRGSNRGVAQFQFEHGLTTTVRRSHLCYSCSYDTARRRITAVPEARLDRATLDAMGRAAIGAIRSGELPMGQFEKALFHLNALEKRPAMLCETILSRYGGAVRSACTRVEEDRGVQIRPEWVLAIICLETGGIIRPRFEQHWLTKLNRESPRTELTELRLRSTSMGLGQIMGFNHATVGAPSARAMFTAPVEDQVLYVARFIAQKPSVVKRHDPRDTHFRSMARFYNGPKYYEHFYHERLARRFREFQQLLPG